MPAFLDITVPLFNFLIMFTVGTGLAVTDFKRLAMTPRTVVLPGIAQMVCLPLAGVVVVSLFSLNPFVVGGVLLISACPGGSISNYYTYLARANVALSVLLTGLTCLAAILTMPLVMGSFEHFMNVPETFHVPIKTLLVTLTMFLLLPILLGMLMRHCWPAFVARNGGWLRAGSMFFLAALIAQVLWHNQESITLDLADTLKASLAMASLSIVTGLIASRCINLSAYDTWAVVIEMMVQNVALATTIAVTVFHQGRFASFFAIYFLVQVPIALAMIRIHLKISGKRSLVTMN